MSIAVPDGKYVRLHIRVRAEGCGHGRVVGVGGSCGELGNFDPRRVLPLVTTPESYPVWYTASPLLVLTEEMLTYKFCIIEGGVFKAFEELPTPRSLVPTSLDTIVENIFNPSLIDRSLVDSEAKLFQILDEEAQRQSRQSKPEEVEVHGSLYIICYHLPVVVERTDTIPSFNVTWGDSLIARTDGVVADAMKTHWVGTVDVPGPPLTEVEKSELVGILLRMSCVVIFLDPAVCQAAYAGYCKQVLWPVFHNVDQLDSQSRWVSHLPNVEPSPCSSPRSPAPPSVPKSVSSGLRLASLSSPDSLDRSSSSHVLGSADDLSDVSDWSYAKSHTLWWQAYVQVNQAFHDSIYQRLHPQDVVWIHDYHLTLLPGMLREDSIPSVSIVFFLHIPFPTSQIFRSLPCASELMRSLLKADLIGFHTYQYARHFLNSSQRTVGATAHTLPGGLFSVVSGDREVVLSMSVVSVEPVVLDAALKDPSVQETADAIRAKYKGKKIIVAVESCQKLSGSRYKFAALEYLLDELEDSRRGDVVLILKAIRSNIRLDDELETSAELSNAARRLNNKFGRVVVDYEEPPSFPLKDRLALWLAGDVFLNTAVREGLNMNAMEFIYARKGLKTPGVVVVSDMSAAASLLNGSIQVSPFNMRQLADAIGKALTMPEADADRRRQRDLPYVTTKTSSLWCKQVLLDLKHGKLSVGIENCHYFQRAPYPHHLQLPKLTEKYSQAMLKDISPNLKRMFIFDFAGTLVAEEKLQIYFKHSVAPVCGKDLSPEVKALLKTLSEDSHNAVLVVTGFSKNKLGGIFDDCPLISVSCTDGLECSWGTDVLSVDELRELRLREEAGRTRSIDAAEDDFQSVSSAHSDNNEYHELNECHVQSIMKRMAPDDALGQFVEGTQSRADFLSDSSLSAEMAGRPSSVSRRMELDSTLRESFAYGSHRHSSHHHHQLHSSLAGSLSYNTVDDLACNVCDVNIASAFSSGNSLRSEWKMIDETFASIDWDAIKSVVIPIISRYSARTNGSCLVSTVPGLGWSYFHAEPEWGTRQAAQLKVELEASLANFNVKVESFVVGSLEIVPRSLKKGNVVSKFIDRVVAKRAGKLPTFILTVGDDRDDDDMFQVVRSHVAKSSTHFVPHNLALYAVTVGRKRGSSAEYYVSTQADVENMLRQMLHADQKR